MSTRVGDGVWTFAAGDLVAGRYKIIAPIARGGAGEVFEAEDTELATRIALKTIRTQGASTTQSEERFRREIQLARMVTHPNVCRIYELGRHESANDSLLFLTMELLDGQTLGEYLASKGPLTCEEALPLISQLAAGLEAAHTAGVVHRDFKTANVILVDDGSAGLRAVITDFGLARGLDTDRMTPLTQREEVLGTPAYMAPEQIRGEEVTPAADIFAFGIVMFEMLTRRLPFRGDTPIATAVERLRKPPSSPRMYIPNLPKNWETAILGCMSKLPADRISSPRAVVAALTEHQNTRALSRVMESIRHRRRTTLLASAAVIFVGMLLAAWVVWMKREPPPALVSNTTGRPSIAMLAFNNLSGQPDAAWLATAIAEMLAMELAAGDDLRVLPSETLARARQELQVDIASTVSGESVSRLHRMVAADLAVVGSYLTVGEGDLRVDLRILRTTDGEVVARASERAETDRLLDLIESTGRALRSELGVGDLSPRESQEVAATRPADTEALRLYASGIHELRNYEARKALELFQQAVEHDPENSLLRSALAASWASLGYRRKAEDESRLALEFSAESSRRDRLWVEARYHDTAGDRKRAAVIYRELWEFFPDELEYGLRLAKAETATGHALKALDTVAELMRLRPESARVAIIEAEAARALGRYEQQREAAVRAQRQASEAGAVLLAARATEIEGGAWRDLGNLDKAKEKYEAAREAFAAANHKAAVARILIAVAKLFRREGRFEEALDLISSSLIVAREIGDQGSVKHALNTKAIILRQLGRLTEAMAMHEQELAANREIEDGRSTQVGLTSLGVVQRRLGLLDAATQSFSEALALGRRESNARSVEINLNLLGEVLLRKGRVEESRRHFEEALEINESTQSRRGRAYYLSSLGDVALAVGELDRAEELHRQALELRESMNENTNVAYSYLSLALVARHRGGQTEQVLEWCRTAATEFEAQQKQDAEAIAVSLAALALLDQGAEADAQAEIARAESLIAGTEGPPLELLVSARKAEITGGSGQISAAVKDLLEIESRAAEMGFVDLDLEAKLLRGRFSSAAEGRELLDRVASESRRLGLILLADRSERERANVQ